MKRNNQIYRLMALLLVLMPAAACTDDFTAPDNTGPATAGSALTITVTDGAYASVDGASCLATSGQPATRAVEYGYATEFTAGDKIGLYVTGTVADAMGTIQENLCLTYNGTDWELPKGVELQYDPDAPNAAVFAYYPYQANGVARANTGSSTATAYFNYLIVYWNPKNNQNTYANYTASDLMVAKGELRNRTDGDGRALHFTMEHQMILAVIQVPTTQCTYTETIDGKSVEKNYRLYTGLNDDGWKENSYTTRLLVNPNSLNDYELSGIYYNSSLEEREFVVHVNRANLSPGTYRLYTIDGGMETVTELPLREGDFYMNDGGIIPQENVPVTGMPADVQNDCLGVVFWVGEKKSELGTSYHWTHESKSGDRLLMYDHPECTHGLVVALTDAASGKTAWSSTDTGSTYTWLTSYAATGQEAEKELILGSFSYLGYNVSRRIQWYRNYGGQPTEAYDAIETFAKTTPTPAGCSGWYFSGDFEMTFMARGTLNYSEDYGMDTILNTQFGKAGGSSFKTDDYYWSSTDVGNAPGKGYCINFSNNSRRLNDKKNTHYVRAVLAF